MSPIRDQHHRVHALLLAAGQSRRFGGDKRRHVLPGGRSMLATTTTLYQSVFDRLRLVISPRDPGLLQELGITLRPGDDVVIAERADLGMGHSLAAGIGGIKATFTFVGLADMPFVLPGTLVSLRESAIDLSSAGDTPASTATETTREATRTRPDMAIIIPRFKGQRGHPVGFGRGWYTMMQSLTGDSGARSIIERARTDHLPLTFVDVEDEGIILDLDQPAGVQRS